LHRDDGPAVELANGDKEWWLHDRLYSTAEAWAAAVLKMHHKPHDDASVQDYLRIILTKNDLI
jgi:hypothetical protein